jgi:hypothetical protein
MELRDIAAEWLATPNGHKWAVGRIKADLAKFPTLGNYSAAELAEALPSAKTPALLAAAILRDKRVTINRVAFEDASIETHSALEPWRSAKFGTDHGADLLGIPRVDFGDYWMAIHIERIVPEKVTGLDILLVAIFRWFHAVRANEPERNIRFLMQNPPAGKDWVITESKGKITVRGAPLTISPTSKTIPKIYDPFDLIQLIEAAIE